VEKVVELKTAFKFFPRNDRSVGFWRTGFPALKP
jgi:hypothetical protein